MKLLISFLFFLAAIAAPLSVLANHEENPILKDKVPVILATCKFGADGKMNKDGTLEKPCAIFIATPGEPKDGDKWWSAILDRNENIVEVIEFVVGGTGGTTVWKASPRGSRAA